MEGRNTVACVTWLASILVLVSGCGLATFADPKTNPIIVNYAGIPFGPHSTVAYAVTSERRMIIVAEQHRICAEPSPDAAENVASQLKLALEAQVTEGSAQGQGRIELGKQLATSVQQLFRRSQGVQLFRDGAFFLCLEWMNGIIDASEYARQVRDLMKTTETLVAQELDNTNGIIGGPPPAVLPVLQATGLNHTSDESATASDYGRALGLISSVKTNLSKRGDAKSMADAKVGLKQVFNIVHSNAVAMKNKSEAGRTLSDQQFGAVLEEVRKVANIDQRVNLATADDVASISDANAFLKMFPVT